MPARFDSKKRDPDAVLVGKLGCQQGGYVRAEKLNAKHLSKIGKHGASVRWAKI